MKYKIAVCLSGQTRTYDYCEESILEYYEGCDFFCHTWDRNSYHEHACPTVIGQWDESILDRIQNTLKPKLFSHTKWEDALIEYRDIYGWEYQKGSENNISMWYSQAKSYDYDFSDYDFVVKSRYDFIHNPHKKIYDTLPAIKTSKNNQKMFDEKFKKNNKYDYISSVENLKHDRFLATDMFAEDWLKKYIKYGTDTINQSFMPEEFFSHNEADFITDSVTANRIREFKPVTKREWGIDASNNLDFLNYVVSDGTVPVLIEQWWHPIRPRFKIMEKDWRKMYDRYAKILKDDCYENGIPPSKEYFEKYMKPGDLVTENALEYKPKFVIKQDT
jgi:hypothetical protein